MSASKTASLRATRPSDELKITDQTNLLPFKQVVAVFFGLSLCALVSCLDSTIIATALPKISADFQAGAISSWVPSAYLLTSTAFQPLYGRFSDIFGRKTAMSIAMGTYMLGCLLAGFAQSIETLAIFRGIAGAGGGGIVGIMQIVISDIVTLRDRGKYQGIIGGVISFGYAVGPLIGGIISQKATWRWCFWVTLPVSVVALSVVLYVLPHKPVQGGFVRKLLAIDYVGVALTLSGCTLLILPLIWGGVTYPWNSIMILGPLFCGALTISVFCIWEWKYAKLPIIPMHIFKHSTVIGVYITMFLNGMIFFSALYYLPQFFQVALAFPPIRSGLFLLPVLVSQTLASFIAGQIVSKTGRYRTVIHVGFAVWAIGCGCVSTIRVTTPRALMVLFMLLTGTGGGQTLQTTTVAAQASVSRGDMAVVTAVRNFVRLLGGTFASAVGSTIINNSLRRTMISLHLPTTTIDKIIDNPTLLGTRLSTSSALTLESLGISPLTADLILDGYTSGFRIVFIMNAILATIATVVSIMMIHHKELTREDEEQLLAEARRQEKLDKLPRYKDDSDVPGSMEMPELCDRQ